MKTLFLKKDGVYTPTEFTPDDYIKWFRDNSTDTGDVKEDVVVYGAAELKEPDGEGFRWVMSDMTLDRDMERMDPSGWELKEYRKNPIVLWGHNSFEPAIGIMKNVKKSTDEKGELTGTVFFDESGDDPLATKIATKVRNGIITKGSVGFRVMKIEVLDDQRDGTQLIHRKQELIEFSIVNIPSNPNAQLQRSAAVPEISEAEPVDEKDYISVLFKDEGHETSVSESSNLNNLFLTTTPPKGKSLTEVLFNGN